MHSLILLALLALCALYDIRTRRIPNALTLGAAAAALAYLVITGYSWLGAPASAALLALCVALLLSLPGYLLGQLGAGDVKLLALIALAGNAHQLLLTLIGAGLAYLTWAIVVRHLWPALSPDWRQRLHHLAPEHVRRYPYAPFIFLGAGVTLV